VSVYFVYSRSRVVDVRRIGGCSFRGLSGKAQALRALAFKELAFGCGSPPATLVPWHTLRLRATHCVAHDISVDFKWAFDIVSRA
jgi:hypothetical protein